MKAYIVKGYCHNRQMLDSRVDDDAVFRTIEEAEDYINDCLCDIRTGAEIMEYGDDWDEIIDEEEYSFEIETIEI